MVFVLFFMFINMVLISSNCPAGTTSTDFNSPHEQRFEFEAEYSDRGRRAVHGPITGDIYQYGTSWTPSTNTNTFMIRFSNLNIIEWSIFFNDFELSTNSLCVDSNEVFMYAIQMHYSNTVFQLLRFHTQNGTVAMAKQINSFNCVDHYRCWLKISSDNTLYGAIDLNTSSQAFVFRYIPDIDTSVSYIEYEANVEGFGFEWLYDSNVFFTYYSSNHSSFIFVNINMTSLTHGWFRNLGCNQLLDCNLTDSYQARPIYNSADDGIYFNFVFSYTLYFFTLNSTDGATTRIHVSQSYSDLYSSYLVDSQTLFTMVKRRNSSPDRAIFVYHLYNASFTEYEFSDTLIRIEDISYNSVNSHLFMYGYYDSFTSTYATDTLIDTIQGIPGISLETTESFSEESVVDYQTSVASEGILPNGSEPIVDSNSPPTAVIKTINTTVDEYLNDWIFYLDTPTSSDYFSLIEGWDKTLQINITCSLNGNTSLEHAIENYENYTVPTWVTLDETNHQLNLSIPEVVDNTDYTFRIRTNEAGNSTNYYKVVNLTVINCGVSNCKKCQIDDATSCYTCSSGYEQSGSICVEQASESVEPVAEDTISDETMSEEVQRAQITTLATVGVTISVIAIVSIINMSSPICIWCVVQQLQILMLLLLTGAFIPAKIKHYISGMSFALFNFDFIGLLKIPFIYEFYRWMILEQNNEDLKNIGVEDGSTFINNIFFLALLLLFIIAHLPIVIVYFFTKSKAGKCNKVFNIAYRVLTFTVYIRLIIENFQNLALSSMSEIYRFEFSSKNRLVSLLIACVFIIFSILFYIFIVYQFWQTKALHKRVSYAYSKELFSGLKKTNKARAYTMIMISRQLFLCCFFIFCQDLYFMVNVIIFFIIQVLFFIMIIAIRPFDQVSNNIVETLNELLLTGLASILLYYNESTRWNATVEKVLIYSITLNNCIVCLVMVISMIISIVLRYIKRKSAKTEVKRYVSNETKLYIPKQTEERHQKDLSDVEFDHYRNNAKSKIENSSRIESDLAIKSLD